MIKVGATMGVVVGECFFAGNLKPYGLGFEKLSQDLFVERQTGLELTPNGTFLY